MFTDLAVGQSLSGKTGDLQLLSRQGDSGKLGIPVFAAAARGLQLVESLPRPARGAESLKGCQRRLQRPRDRRTWPWRRSQRP